jgi:hypothetical protein
MISQGSIMDILQDLNYLLSVSVMKHLPNFLPLGTEDVCSGPSTRDVELDGAGQRRGIFIGGVHTA